MPDPLDTLNDRLVRAGVRPAAAVRYVAELRDHLDDLVAEATARGLDGAEARRQALTRLGSVEALAQPMIADRRFHGWATVRPWAVFLLAPVFAQVAVAAAAAFLLAVATAPGAAPPWLGAAALVAQYVLGGLVPVLTAWVIAAIALRQRCRPTWPMLGIGAVVCIGAMLHLPVTMPAPDRPGTIAITLALPALAHLLALLGLAAAPFLFIEAKTRL